MTPPPGLSPVGVVQTASLYAPLHDELLGVLTRLADDDWARPRIAGTWTVRDVAVHLLDGDLRRLSASRDGHVPPAPFALGSAADVARLVNDLNASAVAWGRRLSAPLVCDLLAVTGRWVAAHVLSLDPDAPATFAVSWAGETESRMWMDIGRDYTERWHHQMQIRDALGLPRLLAPRWLTPLLELAVRSLPPAYTGIDAPGGRAVVFEVPGIGAWTVMRESDRWQVWRGRPPEAACVVRADPDDAWRLFFNALRDPGVLAVSGDDALAAPLRSARAVVL